MNPRWFLILTLVASCGCAHNGHIEVTNVTGEAGVFRMRDNQGNLVSEVSIPDHWVSRESLWIGLRGKNRLTNRVLPDGRLEFESPSYSIEQPTGAIKARSVQGPSNLLSGGVVRIVVTSEEIYWLYESER